MKWAFSTNNFIFLDPGVRDSSAEALGTAMKVVGEKVIMPFLPDMEAMKLAKIKEFCEKAVVSGKPAGGMKAKPTQPSNETKDTPKPADAAAKRPGAVVKKPGVTGTGSSAAAKKPAAKPVVKKPAGSGAKAVEEKVERELSSEEAEEKAAAILPPDVMTGITDANWKTRLGAMEAMIQASFKKLIDCNLMILTVYFIGFRP